MAEYTGGAITFSPLLAYSIDCPITFYQYKSTQLFHVLLSRLRIGRKGYDQISVKAWSFKQKSK